MMVGISHAARNAVDGNIQIVTTSMTMPEACLDANGIKSTFAVLIAANV